MNNWEIGDNEIFEHQRWSPNCPLFKQHITSNVPIEPAIELNHLLPIIIHNENEINEGNRRHTAPFIPLANANEVIAMIQNLNMTYNENTQVMQRPYFPEFAIETTRLRTFEEWPIALKQKPIQLSDAGFFYSQRGDLVTCFSCGGNLRNWEIQDDPWEQHALWFKTCNYVKLLRGSEYIEEIGEKFSGKNNETDISKKNDSTSDNTNTVHNNMPNTSKSTSTIPRIKNNENITNETKLCKICYAMEYNTVFFPCGHIATCAKCASSITKCPICQVQLDRVMKVFFS